MHMHKIIILSTHLQVLCLGKDLYYSKAWTGMEIFMFCFESFFCGFCSGFCFPFRTREFLLIRFTFSTFLLLFLTFVEWFVGLFESMAGKLTQCHYFLSIKLLQLWCILCSASSSSYVSPWLLGYVLWSYRAHRIFRFLATPDFL